MFTFFGIQIKQTYRGQVFALLVWAILMLCFFSLGGPALVTYFQLSTTQQYGAPAKATVLSRNTHRGLYYIVYSFQAPDDVNNTGQRYDRSESVDPELYDSLSEGTVIDIRYDKDNPHQSVIEGNTSALGSVGFGLLSTLMGICFFSTLVWMSISTVRNYNRDKRAGFLP